MRLSLRRQKFLSSWRDMLGRSWTVLIQYIGGPDMPRPVSKWSHLASELTLHKAFACSTYNLCHGHCK
jgi:hypothetical protein